MTIRQNQILIAIVEQYAEVASPVGSTLLAKLFNVSSATIRADMADLEKMGFITQPHTSAGRIPTDKGYRYYVNNVSETNLNQLVTSHERRAREQYLLELLVAVYRSKLSEMQLIQWPS